MDIDTGDVPPKKQSARRMPFVVRQEVTKQLDQMQSNGVIKPFWPPWASLVVLVRRHRFCVDYQALNSVTKPDSFPLPWIDDLLDQLGSSKHFLLLISLLANKDAPHSTRKDHFCDSSRLIWISSHAVQTDKCPCSKWWTLWTRPQDFVSVYLDDILLPHVH